MFGCWENDVRKSYNSIYTLFTISYKIETVHGVKFIITLVKVLSTIKCNIINLISTMIKPERSKQFSMQFEIN